MLQAGRALRFKHLGGGTVPWGPNAGPEGSRAGGAVQPRGAAAHAIVANSRRVPRRHRHRSRFSPHRRCLQLNPPLADGSMRRALSLDSQR